MRRIRCKAIPEKKKTAVGVRGMKLGKGDAVEAAYLMTEATPFKVSRGDRQVDLSKVKISNRDGKGSKLK